jgi:hypothetical protein
MTVFKRGQQLYSIIYQSRHFSLSVNDLQCYIITRFLNALMQNSEWEAVNSKDSDTRLTVVWHISHRTTNEKLVQNMPVKQVQLHILQASNAHFCYDCILDNQC